MSASANDLAEKYFQSGLFGQTRFIELGKPKTSAALDMAAALRRNELLLAVFDEKTDYSIPVTLYKKQLWGGAGLHKLIAFTQRDIALFTIFMLRKKNGHYKLIVQEIDKESKNSVQLLYNSLSDLLADNLEQWYFLHEDLPFIETA
jgi:lauroyl/myristoyl acyltransferase